jgi:hypothetical protein
VTSQVQLTRSSLFNLLCCEGKDEKHLGHHLHDDVGHSLGWWEFNVCLKSFEEIFDALKKVDEYTLAGVYGLSRLADLSVKLANGKERSIYPLREAIRFPR